MSENGKDDHNIVDLASARKKQRTVQPKANARAGANGKPGKGKNGKAAPPPSLSRKVVGAVQVLIVLGTVFYLLQLCRGPGG